MTTMNKSTLMVSQILPIREGESLMLRFYNPDNYLKPELDYIRVVAMAEDTVGKYEANTEYWAPRNLKDFGGFNRGAQLSMKVSSGQKTEEEISKFLSDEKPIRWSESVPFYGWQRFTYTAPESITPYLFSTPDFDDTQARLGMSLLIDPEDKLQGVGWHKTFCPSNGAIWKRGPDPEAVVPFSLDGWTEDPWRVRSCSGYPFDSWWYAINVCKG